MWASMGHSHPRRPGNAWMLRVSHENHQRKNAGEVELPGQSQKQESQRPLKRHSGPGLHWPWLFWGFFFAYVCLALPHHKAGAPSCSRVPCVRHSWAWIVPEHRFGGSALPLHRGKAPALHLQPWECATGRKVPPLQPGTVSTKIYYQWLPMPDNLLQSSLLLVWSLIN